MNVLMRNHNRHKDLEEVKISIPLLLHNVVESLKLRPWAMSCTCAICTLGYWGVNQCRLEQS